MRRRLLVELHWLKYCTQHEHLDAPRLSGAELRHLDLLYEQFDGDQCKRVKEIERRCRHDVKAIELYICERLEALFAKDAKAKRTRLDALRAWVHFGCTSEDINNLAWALMIQSARDTVLLAAYKDITVSLARHTSAGTQVPMLARTHGQAASPTTIGKELSVFLWRLKQQCVLLKEQPIWGKFNGAVGNYNAQQFAYPDLDWQGVSREFVQGLGLAWTPISTQVESRDWMAQLFDTLARINTVLLDLCRDMWGYIALGYFRQTSLAREEVGSSTMPHKINPIQFENAEGNIGIANSLLRHLSDKLPVSRWQRDLSDSTTTRNVATAIGHTLVAATAIQRGLAVIEADAQKMRSDLDQNWSVLAEGIQTAMRKHGIPDAYEQLKQITRGKQVDREVLHCFITDLNLPEDEKKRLLALDPGTYIGLAPTLSLSVTDKQEQA